MNGFVRAGAFAFAFLMLSQARGALHDVDSDQHQDTLHSQLRAKNPESLREKSWSLVIPSVVIHGIQPDSDVAKEMSRKLDASGQTVVTPGAGLQYEGKDGFMAIGAAFKDCYNNLAGTLQLGQYFMLGRNTQWGYSVGVYARETPISCQTVSTRRGTTYVSCSSFDNCPVKVMVTVNGEWVDIIPMPFAHFSTALIKSKELELDFKFMSNFVLNEFGFSIPF